MKVRSFFGFFFALTALLGPSAKAAHELALRTTYSVSSDTLTTEKVWILDPDELNPHRQRWVLNRKMGIVNLRVREIPGAPQSAHYGVAADGIESVTNAYFRGPGPWYRPLTEFPCQGEPVSWFATPEGSRKAADTAEKAWERILASDKLKLAMIFQRVTGASPGLALQKATLLYADWLKAADIEWRTRGRQEAKLTEWKSYLAQAREAGVCAGKRASARRAQPLSWEEMMEPPATGTLGEAGKPEDELQILARAPAKLWDGLFSIRVAITVAGRKLDGRFLIDSSTGTSVISPDFLEGQGILPAWVEDPTAPFRRVPWGQGSSAGQGSLAPQVTADLVEIGNYPLQLKDFALFDTEFFAPPETPKSCCDGVLGTDFLRRYVVEFQPGPPAEVKLWPAESFHVAVSSKWFESALTPAGEPVSTCMATLEDKKHPIRLVGVQWDTGYEDALGIHLPWQHEVRAAIASGRPDSWDLSCGPAQSELIARGVPASFPQVEEGAGNASVKNKVPATSVGMELMGRGRIFFDFPHGRIWFPEQTSNEPILRDNSGLVVRFEFIKGRGDDRGLFVKAIKPRSPAQALVQRGLRPGMMITQIDKIDVQEMDMWLVHRHLAGVFGDKVLVQWKTPQGLKLGEIKVR